jgi:hypothetical protein
VREWHLVLELVDEVGWREIEILGAFGTNCQEMMKPLLGWTIFTPLFQKYDT